MLQHFLKTALRQFQKNRITGLINIFGLAAAMSVCIIIFLFISNELNYDKFHHNHGSIHRLNMKILNQGNVMNIPLSSGAMAPDLYEAMPEVTDYLRMSQAGTRRIFKDGNHFTIENVLIADTNFFDFFGFQLLEGNPQQVLAEPRSVVLTRKTADILFPNDESPLGKTLRINDRDGWMVTGVAENPPVNSHIQFNALTSMVDLVQQGAVLNRWDAHISYYSYVRLTESTNIDVLNEKTEELAWEKVNQHIEAHGGRLDLEYFPADNIRMYSDLTHELGETGTYTRTKWFAIIALFILFVAGFNYVNLTIATSGRRAKETGLKKVVGAENQLIRKQFFTETLLSTALSFILAMLMAELLLPLFNQILNTQLSLFAASWWFFPLALIIFVFFFGFLAGIYPAFFMARLQPAKILKGNFVNPAGNISLRRVLLTLQFVISVGLIICTLVVFLQLYFFRNQSYGFEQHNLIALGFEGEHRRQDAQLLAENLTVYPWITQKSIATAFPGEMNYREGFELEGSDQSLLISHMQADRHFLETLGARMQQGRFFLQEDGLELENVIVNQELVRRAGWDNPIGKTLYRNQTYRVVGVMEDFHFESFHQPVTPLVISALGNSMSGYGLWLLVRFDERNASQALPVIQQEWEKVFPERTIYLHFVDQVMGEYYRVERNFGLMFLVFSALTIVIAMLGVLGLAMLSTRQRMKEVAVRRVLGASVLHIFKKFSVEYVVLIFVAAVLAVPLAYYFMESWLAGFAYAISFPHWTVIAALLITTGISMAIIAVQTLKAGRMNPSVTLKYE